jgi:hypothetical protein
MAELFGDSDDDQEIEERLDSNGVMAFHSGTEEALFVFLNSKAPFNGVDELLKLVDEYW